eukprot:scaffold207977_cov35-Tisochrysis_lutea.AAC.1
MMGEGAKTKAAAEDILCTIGVKHCAIPRRLTFSSSSNAPTTSFKGTPPSCAPAAARPNGSATHSLNTDGEARALYSGGAQDAGVERPGGGVDGFNRPSVPGNELGITKRKAFGDGARALCEYLACGSELGETESACAGSGESKIGGLGFSAPL